MEHTIVDDPSIGKPTMEVDPSAADVRTALPSLFILEDFTMPTTAPVVHDACSAAARILRSEFFRSVFNRAVGKKGPRHNSALSNQLTKGFPVDSDASPGAVNFELYTSLEEGHNASEESSKYICLSPVLLAHINNVLRSLTNNPAHLQAKQNFTALLAVKLVREVSRLLVFYFCPDETKIRTERKKIMGDKEYGDHFETLLFGGVVKLTTWLGYEVALKQPACASKTLPIVHLLTCVSKVWIFCWLLRQVRARSPPLPFTYQEVLLWPGEKEKEAHRILPEG